MGFHASRLLDIERPRDRLAHLSVVAAPPMWELIVSQLFAAAFTIFSSECQLMAHPNNALVPLTDSFLNKDCLTIRQL